MGVRYRLTFLGACLGSLGVVGACIPIDTADLPPGTPGLSTPSPSNAGTASPTPSAETSSPTTPPLTSPTPLTPTPTPTPADIDGDGFAGIDDCDEGDPDINIDAAEACEPEGAKALDNDCDGKVDEGVSQTWYEDLDGDGFGNDRAQVKACWAPGESYVLEPGDCDTSDALVYPGAPELCDGQDNDCNGTIDDAPDNSGDGTSDCSDDDGDGESEVEGDCDDGDSAVSSLLPEQCTGVDNDCDGTIDEGADADADGDGFTLCEECDDTDPLKRPDASFELMDNKDNDCDGVIDEPQVASLEAAWTYQGPTTNAISWCGSAMQGGVDFNQDGHKDFAVTCPLLGGRGRATVFFGDGARLTPQSAPLTLRLNGDSEGAAAGSGMALGDMNGDGLPDLVVSQPVINKVSVLYGPLSPEGESQAISSLASTGGWEGSTFFTGVGWSLALADLDNDGDDDLVAGAPLSDGLKGRVYILPGGSKLPLSFNFPESSQELTPLMSRSEGTFVLGGGYGSAMTTIGDFDGDGKPDVAIGAWRGNGVSSRSGDEVSRGGAVEILYGGQNLNSLLNGGGQRAVIGGAQVEGGFGYDVSAAGDVNGDGLVDLLVGAPFEDGLKANSGKAYIILGGDRLSDQVLTTELGERLHGVITCPTEDCKIGTLYNTRGLGDVNGDGWDDIAVGAVGYGTQSVTNRGAGALFFGGEGALVGETSIELADAFFLGTLAEDNLGALGNPGDLDGDGASDLLLGAYLAKVDDGEDSAEDAGEAYLFYGY